MRRALPLATRRCFRLALAAGIATAFGFGLGLPLGYLLVVLTVALLAPAAPPPGPKAVAALVVILGLTSLYGLLLGPVLVYVPLAGVLMVLAAIALAALVGQRPGGAVIGTLMVLGCTIIAVIAVQSSAAAVTMLKIIMAEIVGAIAIGHVAHALFPEDGAAAPPPAPAVADPGWIALRSAIIMLPPLLAALIDPGAYIMLLIKGAALTQQADSGAARRMGREMVGSTAMGGAAALALWWLLSLWPSIELLVLGMMLMILLLARPLYGAVASRFPASWWTFAMINAVVLIGPAVGDSANGTDIQRQLVIRWATFTALAVYAALAVHGLDRLRGRRVQAGTA